MTVPDARARILRERLIATAIVLVCAAAVIGLMIHNRRLSRQIATEIYVPRATPLSDDAATLQAYIRINTTNPPGNEIAGATWLGAQLKSAGIPFEIIESAPGRANLYARIEGTQRGEGLLLLNHIDVVRANPADGWTRPPFSGSVAIGMLHGRGSIDMKGLAVCQLAAMKALAATGHKPLHDVVFLAVADEEAGSAFGIRWLLDHRPELFEGIRYALTEGGVTEMGRERVTYFGIEIGSKQTIDLDLVAPSRAQMQQARIALEPYAYPRDVTRIEPGVRAFFHAVAPNRLEGREIFADVDRAAAEGKLWLLPPLNRALLENSVWPYGVSQLPDGRFTMRVVLSNLYDEKPADRLAWLTQVVSPFGASIGNVRSQSGPAPLSPFDTPLWRLLARAAEDQIHPVLIGPEVLPVSVTDCRFLRPRGVTCYGFQAFPTDFFQTRGIHGPDERIRLDWFDLGVRIMKQVVMAYASGR